MKIGSVIAQFKSDLSGFKQGLNEAQTGVKGFSDKASSALGAVRNASLVVSGAIAGVTAVALNFGATAGKYESIRDAFGSMSKGLISDVGAFEAKVADASAGTLDKLTILQGGTRALSLIGKDAFSDFGDQFAKMAELSKKSARATGQDVTYMFDSLITGMSRESKMILDNLGITVDLTQAKSDYAAELGKSVDELSISESKTAVLNHTLGKLEETYGDVSVSSGGFAGAWQKLQAQLTDARIEIGTELLPVLNDLVRQIIPLFKEYLPKFIDGIKKGVEWFKELSPAGQKVVAIIALMAPVLAVFAAILGPIISLLPLIISGIGGLVTVVGFLLSPIGLVVLAIGALIAIGYLLYKNWDEIKNKATELFNTIKEAILSTYEEYVKPVLTAIGEAFTWLWESIIKPVIDKIVAYYQMWYDMLAWVWNNLIEPILLLIAAIFARIFFEIYKVIKKNLEDSWNFWRGIFETIWNFIKPWLEAALELFKTIWNAIKTATQSAWEFIKQKIIEPLTNAYNSVREVADGILQKIRGTWDDIVNKINSVKDSIYNAITEPFRKAKEKIEEIANKIREAADKISPFHKESPSLVENVEKGISQIKNAYASLGSFSTPAVSGSFSGGGVQQIVVNLPNALISGPDVAEDYAEIIGDRIIDKLQKVQRS